ncbi:oligosaccharide flippase family protein [Patescibacteria group bacterium]|nr:oligosaccharide flippase family protein [Patescibacteria group bacterium]
MSHQVTNALAKSTALQVAGKVISTIFGLATFYLLLHIFGTSGYGEITTATTYVSIFAIIVDFGLTLTTAQMISEHKADEKRILGNLLSLRVISALIFMGLAPIGALFLPSENILPLIFVATGSYFCSAVAQTFIGVFQKRLTLVIPVAAELANRSLALGVIALAGFWQLPIIFSTIGFFVGALAQLVIMVGFAIHAVRFTPRMELKIWKEIITRSWPIGLSILFNLIYLKGDIFFMWIFNRTSEEIGQYGAAYKVIDVVTMIPITFMGLILPLLVAAWTQKNKELFHKRLQDAFDFFVIFALPIAAGAALVGTSLMTFVKPDLILAGHLQWIMGPVTAIVFFNTLYGHAIVAINKQKQMVLGYLVVALLSIIGYITFIPTYGAWAAALVTLVSEVLITAIAFTYVTKTTGSLPKIGMALRALIATITMSTAIFFLPMPNPIMSVALGVIVYGCTLILVGGPKPRDIKLLFLPTTPGTS